MNDLPISALSECAARLSDKYKRSVVVEASTHHHCFESGVKHESPTTFRIHVIDQSGGGAHFDEVDSLEKAESMIVDKMASNSPEAVAQNMLAQARDLQARAAGILEKSKTNKE